MTNASRQKAYRDRKRNAKSSDSAKSVTNPAPNVTKNPVSVEIPRQSKIPDPVTPTPDSDSKTRIASLEDYNAHPDDYSFRACAELLNWGTWMSTEELKFSEFSTNRQIVPGDWDFKA